MVAVVNECMEVDLETTSHCKVISAVNASSITRNVYGHTLIVLSNKLQKWFYQYFHFLRWSLDMPATQQQTSSQTPDELRDASKVPCG
jgi:hypothetical protein